MSLLVVIEILNEDGSEVTDNRMGFGRDFDIAQLKLMEDDRRADGYVNLDGTNYVFNAKIVGVAEQVDHAPLDGTVMAVTPIEVAL
jgi:hypothetical protein